MKLQNFDYINRPVIIYIEIKLKIQLNKYTTD